MARSEPLSVLFLRLEGALQSWGDDSQWSVRRTRGEPTKSGIIGLLAAAKGYGRDASGDREVARLGGELRMAVRVDRPGALLRDYHTVVGGVLSAEGKVKINAATREPETVVSERYYLSDACFLVALAGPADTLADLADALQRPVWTPYLGRRSCPPSAPLWPALPDRSSAGDYPDLETALTRMPSLGTRAGDAQEAGRLRVVVELPPGVTLPQNDGIVFPRHDVPISFSRRQFAVRYVEEFYLESGGAA
jgi:CRISPR system Cascade subunit CasD